MPNILQDLEELLDSIQFDSPEEDWEQVSDTYYDPDEEDIDEDYEQPEMFEDSFYDYLDNQLQKMYVGGDPPRGAKNVGRGVELYLYQSLKKAINEYMRKLTGNEPKNRVIQDLTELLRKWKEQNVPKANAAFEKLFRLGFDAGIISTGKMGTFDKEAMNIIKEGKYRIGERIKLFSEDVVPVFEKVIKNVYTPEGTFTIDSMIKEMGKEVSAQRYQLERIARTETGNVTNLGRLWSWQQDPDKNFYKYYWRTANDNRVREMKKMRQNDNPYTFPEIKFLFFHNAQMVNNQMQMGAINCRCTLSRTPSDDEKTENRFDGKENLFEKTVDITF